MVLKGEPNQVVNTVQRLNGGRQRVLHLFTFDDKGFYDVDTSKLSPNTLERLKQAFTCVEKANNKKDTKKDVETSEEVTDIDKLKFFDLKKLAIDKGMEVNAKTNKEEIMEFLNNL